MNSKVEAALADCPSDTLINIFRFHDDGGMVESISRVGVAEVDATQITLKCHLSNGSNRTKSIPFRPSLRELDRDLKTRILEMGALAREGLGLVDVPWVERFQMPPGPPVVMISVYLAFLIYLHWVPAGATSSFWAPAKFIIAYPYVAHGTRNAFNVTFVVHILESVYTCWLCYKHRSPFLVAAKYIVATMFFGYTVWMELRKVVKALRIASMMKDR